MRDNFKAAFAVLCVVLSVFRTTATTWYVNGRNGSDANDGSSENTAFRSIQRAIMRARSSDVIRVEDGTYAPITAINKDIRIESVHGPSATIIDGRGVDRCATLGGNTNDMVKTTLVGFTLRNGRASERHGSGASALSKGGGACGGILENCILSGNTSWTFSGGAHGSVLRRCILDGNIAADDGGGAWGCLLSDCLVKGNCAENEAGGGSGGGLKNCTAVRCTIVENKAIYRPARSTNDATYVGGGGIDLCTVTDCILYGNTLTDGRSSDAYNSTVVHSFLSKPQMGLGTGNSFGNPLFVDAANGNYRLQAGSPCIDRARTGNLSQDALDLDGHLRIAGSRVDIGCYEYGSSTPAPRASHPDVSGQGLVPAMSSGRPPVARRSPSLQERLVYRTQEMAFRPVVEYSEFLISILNARESEADQKRESLRTKVVEALEKCRQTEQDKGNFDGVMLFAEMKADPDSTPQTDNKTLLGILSHRDKAKAAIGEWLVQEQRNVLASGIKRLESMKSDATKKGNLLLAQEIHLYQKTVEGELRNLESHATKSAAPSSKPPTPAVSQNNPPNPPPVSAPIGTARTITVDPEKENGTSLGRFEKGEIVLIQYVSGTYSPSNYSNPERINPDSATSRVRYSSEPTPRLTGPMQSAQTKVREVPKNTASKPFAVLIEDSGFYSMAAHNGDRLYPWKGILTYRVTKFSVIQAQQLRNSEQRKKYQW